MDNQTCKTSQAEEIEALAAIFGDDFTLQSDNSFSIELFNSSRNEFYLQVTFPEHYPLHSPPKYDISAPWMKREVKNNLCKELEKLSSQYKGECIIYLWTDFIKDFIEQDSSYLENNVDSVADEQEDLKNDSASSSNKIMDEVPDIMHSETIKDRKSIFQAHLARVGSLKQVNQVLEKLKENKKIASATHNIYAYRIKSDKNGVINFDCEDDGESKAGQVLLHLLEVLDLTDILIVVSRWYGGIHLGPIRFRHIGDVAKNLINELGLVKK